MSSSSNSSGCKLTIYFGNTRVASEDLNATGDDHIFTFDHTPVSTRNLRLRGDRISAIQAEADNGDGRTMVTSAGHGFANNTLVTIAGTVNYDGSWNIILVDINRYIIRTAFVINEGVLGTGTASDFIVNFDLEPLTGTITIAAALPAYDNVNSAYFYYVNTADGIDILTQKFRTVFPRPTAKKDIWGQPHYQIHNNYPHKITLKVVLAAESQRNLLTEAMFGSAYFIAIDRNFDSTYGFRAYEGPLWSDEQGSIFKGASYLLPIELFVEQFGRYNATLDEITWGFWEQ